MEKLIGQIKAAPGVLVLTGAGISVPSGIAPFRGADPDAVWNRDVTEKGTFSYFRRRCAGVLDMVPWALCLSFWKTAQSCS